MRETISSKQTYQVKNCLKICIIKLVSFNHGKQFKWRTFQLGYANELVRLHGKFVPWS